MYHLWAVSQPAVAATKLYSLSDKQTLCFAGHAASQPGFSPSFSRHHAVSVYSKVPLLSFLLCPLISRQRTLTCGLQMSVHAHVVTHTAWFVPTSVGARRRENKTGVKLQHDTPWNTCNRSALGVSLSSEQSHRLTYTSIVRRDCSSGVLQCKAVALSTCCDFGWWAPSSESHTVKARKCLSGELCLIW